MRTREADRRNVGTGVAVSTCRFCSAPLERTFVDLGMSPLCESYLTADQLEDMEPFYPLHVRVCEECFLVQLPAYVPPEEIFTEYAYFSSYSDSWVEHARAYTERIIKRLDLSDRSLVVEIASNDGYLLQHFIEKRIPVLGIEPARNVTEVALERGVPTRSEFFGRELAEELRADGRSADLVVANNVLAQVPEVNDFVAGMAALLAPGGVITVEFPHLARLIEENQFDTIYHEHFSYFSFLTACRIFAAHGLEVFDVEELRSHGGSLRLYAAHAGAGGQEVCTSVGELAARERAAGVELIDSYASFRVRVEDTKRRLLQFLIDAKSEGRTIVGYGAPGKGNTLLNYCGIRTDFLEYTVDRNPYKQGRFLPGTHIPILAPEAIAKTCPDFVLVLPWNLKDEIVQQLSYIREWGGCFIIPIPSVQIIS